MDWTANGPVGMTKHKEMLNILIGLYETGGCDARTLRIVAQSVGIRDWFDQEIAKLPVIMVEKPPVYLLSD